MRRLAVIILAALFLAVPNADACTQKRYCGKHHSRAYNKRVISQYAKSHKVSKRDLMYLAKRESGYRNCAENHSCKGLFQVHTHAGLKKLLWMSPQWNTHRAIHYIKKRYGTTANAVAHSRRYGWY